MTGSEALRQQHPTDNGKPGWECVLETSCFLGRVQEQCVLFTPCASVRCRASFSLSQVEACPQNTHYSRMNTHTHKGAGSIEGQGPNTYGCVYMRLIPTVSPEQRCRPFSKTREDKRGVVGMARFQLKPDGSEIITGFRTVPCSNEQFPEPDLQATGFPRIIGRQERKKNL